MSSKYTYSSRARQDTIIYEEVLKKLKRRRLFAKRTLILFDRGYYSLNNYTIRINRFKIIPIIFLKYENIEQKLSDNLEYPLEIYNKTNNETINQVNNVRRTKKNTKQHYFNSTKSSTPFEE